MKTLSLVAILLSAVTVVSGHARCRYPKPLGYGSTPQLSGNAYNAPLKYDGSDFPCKGLIGTVDMTPQAEWAAGGKGMFEIQPNDGNGGEGNMAAHSGGSCQASISYDNGNTFKVMHSWEGGCPRDVPLNSNIAGPNQTFTFDIPPNAMPGKAIFAWTWMARTGNRGEFYMNCASVKITGSGTSDLSNYPDMYVGEMVKGDIKEGMCKSTAENYFLYPYPGYEVTKTTEVGDFLGPHGPGPDGTYKVCKAPGGGISSGPPPPTTSTAPQESTSTTPEQNVSSSPPSAITTSSVPYPSAKPQYDTFDAKIDGYYYECRLKQ